MVYQSSSSDPRCSSQLSLPPGFRFYPTDEELLVQYLCRKIAGYQFDLQIIADVDLYKFDPWDLPSKAIFGENEWYFFSPRDRKYPNGTRPNRLAGCGYWKATGTDKIITTTLHRQHVGIKKSLVFYVGKAPKGAKTDWIMHEYKTISSTTTPPNKFITTTSSSSSKLDDWVLCRIYKKSANGHKPSISNSSDWASKYESVNLDLNRLASGDFNWATLARLTMPPNEAQFDGTSNRPDGIIMEGEDVTREVQSQRVNDFVAQNLNPFESSYPAQSHRIGLFGN